MVCLIKPQFEAGREKVGRKGVVRDRKVHVEVIEMILAAALEQHFEILGLDFSPVRGPEGNIEYLMWIRKKDENYHGGPCPEDPETVTLKAHEALQ